MGWIEAALMFEVRLGDGVLCIWVRKWVYCAQLNWGVGNIIQRGVSH